MMKYFIFALGLLLNGCFDIGCWDYQYVGDDEPTLVKKFTVVNRTGKTYTNNALYHSFGSKIKGIWKSYSYRSLKINSIEAHKTLNKNEKGKELKLDKLNFNVCSKKYSENYTNLTKGVYFLFSLNGGKRKVFFGDHGYGYKEVFVKKDTESCKKYYTWNILHPVWQERELTITIEKDGKITFSDPKIKEVKKLKARENNEEIELKNLEIVPCD